MRSKIAKLYRLLPIVRELCQIRELVGELNASLHRLNSAESIRLWDFDLHEHPRYGDSRRLLRYQARISSQNGEDGIIHEIFRRIGVTTKTFVEIGVGDGIQNNTSFLLSQGWTGHWIDGSSEFRKALESKPELPRDAVRSLVTFVTAENVVAHFEKLDVPAEFDLLSIDIDQNTYYVWESLGNYRPRVVVIEYNSALPADVDWQVAYRAQRTWDGTQNFGASLKALEILGVRLGYSLVGCDPLGINAFFVRDDLLGDQFLAPYTAENHYEPPRFPLGDQRAHPPSILDR